MSPKSGSLALLPLLLLLAGAALSSPAARADTVPQPGTAAVAPAPGSSGAPDYLARVRAGFTPENRAYAAQRTALAFIAPAWAVVTGLLLLFTGLSRRMRDLALRLSRRRYLQVLAYFTLFCVAAWVIGFPLSWYQGFALEQRFGLSTQGFGAWLGDELKSLLVLVVFLGVIPLVYLAYGALARSPRRWWVWLGVGTLPVMVTAVLITPLFVEPLFNRFTPLHDQSLKADILELAGRSGIPAADVFEVDKSQQTRKINAYVTGLGATHRIVLWDTTLKGMKRDEILFVMGHEMGHYRLGHIWKGIAFTTLASFLLFWATARVMAWAVRRWGGRWGFHELHDVASLPLFMVALTVVTFVFNPLGNAWSRSVEHDSDIFGLEATRSNDAAARAFIALAALNRSNPEPSGVVKFFLYSHPPLIERIRFAESYRPWETGEPNRLFRPARNAGG